QAPVNIHTVLKSLLFRNPDHNEPAITESGYDRSTLVICGRLIDGEFRTQFLSRRRKALTVNVLQRVGPSLIIAGPDDDQVPISQSRDSRVHFRLICGRVDADFPGEPGIAG